MSFLPLLRLWIWLSALASAAGWGLSALGALNRAGYAVVFVLGLAALWIFRAHWAAEWQQCSIWNPQKLRSRFTRPLPLLFLMLAVLVLLGAVLYPPSNHTAVTYRLPRTLHWLAAGEWHWIHTPNYRMNNRACGIEWMSAPLLLFTQSDRLLFLLNYIPYLLLPGLVYSVLTRLGVRLRSAWSWMWLLPAGYTFLLQAGSTGNDTFPTLYALAAIDFALRFRTSGRQNDLWLSILSAALLTGAKASNLPLLLPWALLLLKPGLTIRWVPLLPVLLLAAVVSFLPTAILNVIYCGDWSGLRLERTGMDMKHPLVGIWGNTLLFLFQNLLPPFFPLAGWWNQHALEILPQAIVGPMNANFEQGYQAVSELPTEDWAGLGFGVTLWLIISVLWAWAGRTRSRGGTPGRFATPMAPWVRTLVLFSPWLALLAYCMKSGMVTGARLISPYYPLLLPALLYWGGHERLVRTRWWQRLAALVMVFSIPVLVVTPGRPLWPAQTILSRLERTHPQNRIIERAARVYAVYGVRSDPLAGVRALLPTGLRVVGFLGTEDDPDISLWRPFGSRRVKHLLVQDSGESIRQRGIDYVVVGGYMLKTSGETLDHWLTTVNGELVASTNAVIKVAEGSQPWYVVRMK